MKRLTRTWLSCWLSCFGLVSAAPTPATPIPDRPQDPLLRGVVPIEIELSPAHVRQLKSSPREYVEGQLTIAGIHLQRIGVRLKGSVGSFQPLDQKPSLTLDLNRFDPQASVDGLKKLHLNNAVEDPSYLCEWLGGALFREAGIPSPSVGHARVRLNGRSLGLYVLKEGFSRDFLNRSHLTSAGSLLEPEPRQDVRGQFHPTVGPKDSAAQTVLKDWTRILDEPNLNRRRDALNRVLGRDPFVRFMAMEVLLGHRDGYTLARNNYRIYVESNPTSIVFLPHGMDQLFQNPKARPNPSMAGDVARAWMEIPENATLYLETLQSLNSTVLEPGHVSRILDGVWNELKGSLTLSESRNLRKELDALKERAHQRHQHLSEQFARASLLPLEFQGTNAQLRGWKSIESHTGTVIEHPSTGTVPARLQLTLSSPGWVSASTTAVLTPGRYRLRSVVRVQDFQRLPFGKHQGAFLRIADLDVRSQELEPTETPQKLEIVFEITGKTAQQKTVACELRGQRGSAWFDLNSFQMERITPVPTTR